MRRTTPADPSEPVELAPPLSQTIKGPRAPWSNPESRETLIQSQSQISYGFLYIASSSSSLNSSLFASDDSLLCIKIQE